ncbi:MAG: hypothetical protein JW793_13825 [Acidobacteria bacterium]|nr:hypothetical protein [Acidobacteriota bacterium]
MRPRRSARIFWTVFSILGLWAAALAQDTEPDLRKDIEALKQGQQTIRRDLEELKALIRALQPARPATPDVRDVEFDLGDNLVLGEETASLTLVEFTDYQ